jgi:hypothetical protein
MEPCDIFGNRFRTGEANPPPKPDNDNWRLTDKTPAEFMQWVRRRQERLRREMVADERLLACPEHRLTLDIALAMEKCCRWHYYGER